MGETETAPRGLLPPGSALMPGVVTATTSSMEVSAMGRRGITSNGQLRTGPPTVRRGEPWD